MTPPHPTPSSPVRPSPHWWGLALIVAAGALLRVHGLDHESAWLDETFSIGAARGGWANVLYEARLDVHPPLYYFLLTPWLVLVGDSVSSARLLSVVLSLAVLVAAWAVGRRLAGPRVGLFAAALLAVSVFQVEFAQEARMYALFALLATLSTSGLVDIYARDRRRDVIPYVFVTALMVWTHVYAAFVIAAQGLSILIDLGRRRRDAVGPATRWVWAQVLVLAAFLPWLPAFTWQVSLVQTRFWIAEPDPWAWLAAFRTYVGAAPLLWLFVPLAVWGAVRGGSRGAAPVRPALFFLLPWLAGPILFPFLLSRVSQPIFLPKYTIAASVPFAILVAMGIDRLPTRVLRASVLAACLIWSATLLPGFYARRAKDGWREAVPVVEQQARPGDAVVLYPYFNKIAWDFYRQRTDLQVRPFPLFTAPPPADGWPVTITRATAGRDRIWFVTLEADGSAEAVLAALATTHETTRHEVRQKVAIYQLDRRR